MIRSLALCLDFGLAACAQTAPPVATAPQAKPEMPADPATEAECLAARGKWGPVGLMGTPACTMTSPTAGKVCSDSKDCAGQCWADAPAGTRTTGMCQPTNMPFGCHSELVAGVVQPALCAD